ncbi:MAG: Rho termination factor N-terminal domain-containing protein, partial [Oscillospiraceae bacterium]|nr:Rho termination factor N-terminal domain-containing protein [Oscillospiraceae bacterium]
MEIEILKGKTVAELRIIASALGVEGASGMKKKELFELLSEMSRQAEARRSADEADAKEASQTEKNSAEDAGSPAESSASARSDTEPEVPAPAPKKRGRKKKSETAAQAAPKDGSSEESVTGDAEVPASAETEEATEKKAAPADSEAPEKKTAPDDTASATEKAAPAGSDAAADKKPDEPQQQKEGRYEITGVLDLAEGGFGFLRFDNFLTSEKDIYVSPTLIRRFGLKTGDMIYGIAHEPGAGERFGGLLYVKTVNGDEPVKAVRRPDFGDLTPIYPERRIVLEKGSNALSMRLTDLVAPIGLGQRGIIVAPPKAGKTTLLKQIAKSIEAQNVDAELIVLLIDERPEEVTDMQRSVKAEVIA